MLKRDAWLDGIKFLLIVLVVFGHSKQFTCYDKSLFSVKLVSYTIHSIYLFHMPLFILISGYVSKKVEIRKFVHSTIRLFKIFLLFHFLWIGIDLFRGEPFSFQRLIDPSFTFWYLLSLIYWRVLLQFLPEKYDRSYVILPVTLIISLLGGLIPLVNEFSIPRTLTFMPIFFLGYYAKQNNWLGVIRKVNLFWFVIPAFFLILLENKLPLDIHGRKPYVESVDALKRILFLSSSIIISIAFIRLLPQKVSVFSEEGRDVLFYYVYHSFVLFLIATFLSMLNVIVGGVGLVIVSICTLGLLFLCRKISFMHQLIS